MARALQRHEIARRRDERSRGADLIAIRDGRIAESLAYVKG